MNNQVDITTLTVIELKALAYDQLGILQNTQRNLEAINQQIVVANQHELAAAQEAAQQAKDRADLEKRMEAQRENNQVTNSLLRAATKITGTPEDKQVLASDFAAMEHRVADGSKGSSKRDAQKNETFRQLYGGGEQPAADKIGI